MPARLSGLRVYKTFIELPPIEELDKLFEQKSKQERKRDKHISKLFEVVQKIEITRRGEAGLGEARRGEAWRGMAREGEMR